MPVPMGPSPRNDGMPMVIGPSPRNDVAQPGGSAAGDNNEYRRGGTVYIDEAPVDAPGGDHDSLAYESQISQSPLPRGQGNVHQQENQ